MREYSAVGRARAGAPEGGFQGGPPFFGGPPLKVHSAADAPDESEEKREIAGP